MVRLEGLAVMCPSGVDLLEMTNQCCRSLPQIKG
jgi:hypothetical protein